MACLSQDQMNQVFGELKAGPTVNDITHHFGCPRQTIHNLMKLYNSTGSVRVRGRPGHTHVTTLRPYGISTFTHRPNHFNQQPLLF